MKRVFAHAGAPVVREVAEPTLRPGEVLVDTAYSVISAGTELWIIDGTADPDYTVKEYPPDPPRWPKIRHEIASHHPLPRSHEPDYHSVGYSLAGRVRAVHDDVLDLEPGDLVACSGSQCSHHAEVVAVPRNLVARVPEGLPLPDAAFVTLGGVATTGLRETRCQFGETVVLYGMGLLGLLAAQIGIAAGFNIIGLDIDEDRLDFARRLGVADVFNPQTTDVAAAVRELTDGFGADAVVLGVKTESSEPINLAFDMCRQGARVIGQGLFGWEIDRGRLYANQVSVHPAVGYGLGRYDPVYEEGNVDFPIGLGRWTGRRNAEQFLRMMREGAVSVDGFSPAPVPIDEAPAAYELLRSPNRPLTVLLEYPQRNGASGRAASR
jgi:threonine dehydrogenase-like Zn-dependent dehydrogenase